MESRYSWKNDKGGIFDSQAIVVDNVTKCEYRLHNYGMNTIKLPEELQNEEFIIWAICTTRRFINYVRQDFYTFDRINKIVENFEYPIIFHNSWNGFFADKLTKEHWLKAFARNNEVARYIPSKYQNEETLNSLSELDNVSIDKDLIKILTPEIFEKIYFNLDEYNKKNLFTFRKSSVYKKNNQRIRELVTQRIADDILSFDIKAIGLIPSNYVSEENAIKAMDTNIELLKYVPGEYQTIDRQYELINLNPSFIDYIDPNVLLDEVIIFALSKKGTIFSKIPVERRTYEISMAAVNYYPGSLKYVPDEVKTAEMCFNAVARKQDMIKYVPVKFLTEEFVEALNRSHIIIPANFSGYVSECLKANNKINGEDINPEETFKYNLNVNEDFINMRLNTIPTLFMNGTLAYLEERDIYTIGDLLNKTQNKEFNSEVLKDSVVFYKEITTALKLLKCKYLNIDPLVDLTINENTTMDDVCEMFGFDARVTSSVKRKGYTPKEFFDLLKDDEMEFKLRTIRNLGTLGIEQIMFKTSIILNYYENKKNNEKNMTEDETIESLTKELLQTKEEIQRLNSRVDEILLKIQEKTLGKKKGGL